MAKYKGRDVTILHELARLEDALVVVQTKDGGKETVKKADVTVYSEKDIPVEMLKVKEDKTAGYRLATPEEVAEKTKQDKAVADKAVADQKATVKTEQPKK